MAREFAGLTQDQLAARVPMAQSTLAAAESSGTGSRKTAQIAHHCGVNAFWLATGKGEMLAAASASTSSGLAQALQAALNALASVPKAQQGELLERLGMWVRYQDEVDRLRLYEMLGASAGQANDKAAA